MGYKNIEKKREYQRNWIAGRREKYLKDKGCAKKDETCEGDLQVDHIDPSQKWTHRFWSYSWEKIEAEMKKCQILCASHHYRKTAADIRKMKQKAHGTQAGYDKWRCRCEQCIRFGSSSPGEYHAGITLGRYNTR